MHSISNTVFCNGNDQLALQSAIDRQAATITRSGGGGPVYVAPSVDKRPLSITKGQIVTITHSYIYSGSDPSITMTNNGIGSDGNLEVDDVLSESLNNLDFLVINGLGGQVTDITLRRVQLADAVGNSYLIKQAGKPNFHTTVPVEEVPLGSMGAGLVDPASTAARVDISCIGNGPGRKFRPVRDLAESL